MALDFTALDFSPEVMSFVGKDKSDDVPVFPEIEELKAADIIPPFWTSLECWDNYMDKRLYELDKAVREYIKHMQHYSRTRKGFRTSADLVFAAIFHRPCEPRDGFVMGYIHKLLNYYCTSCTGQTTVHGKKVPRAYKFSTYGGQNKRPLSIKLRMEEEFEKNGRYQTQLTFSLLKSEARKEPTKRTVKRDGQYTEVPAGRPDRDDGCDGAEGRCDDTGGSPEEPELA